MLPCTIQWLDLTTNIGKEYCEKVKNSNLLQSPAYGRAWARMHQGVPKQGLIALDGQIAGYFQLLEHKALRGAVQAIMLDRGPLWLPGYGEFAHFESFFHAFRQAYPPRIGRALRIIPELEDSEALKTLLSDHGFKNKSKSYQTLIIDLTQNETALRANLKKNWRAQLHKAEKTDLQIEWDNTARHFDWLLKHYALDKRTKGYGGPSVEFLRALSRAFTNDGDMRLARVLKNGRCLAAILLFCHGRSATYQIGWNTQEGRTLGAHNLLLWQAVLELQKAGFQSFDLGGVNDEEAQNVKKFKSAMGGHLLTLPGLYSTSFFRIC